MGAERQNYRSVWKTRRQSESERQRDEERWMNGARLDENRRAVGGEGVEDRRMNAGDAGVIRLAVAGGGGSDKGAGERSSAASLQRS